MKFELQLKFKPWLKFFKFGLRLDNLSLWQRLISFTCFDVEVSTYMIGLVITGFSQEYQLLAFNRITELGEGTVGLRITWTYKYFANANFPMPTFLSSILLDDFVYCLALKAP